MDTPFHFKNKVLLLRLNRLGHVPPAYYSTQILKEHGVPVLVYEFGDPSEAGGFIEGEFPKLRASGKWARFLPRAARSSALLMAAFAQLFWRIILSGRPHLIITHGIQEQCLAVGLAALFRIKYVCHVHEVYRKKELSFFLRRCLALEGMALRRAEFLIFPQATRAELYQKRYAFKNKVHIVANCPRLRKKGKGIEIRKQLELPEKSQLLAYIGGIGESNAVLEAVEALRGFPELYFILMGWSSRHYLKEVSDRAKACGVKDRIFYLGEVEDKWGYLDSCDLSYCLYVPHNMRLEYMGTSSNKFSESLAAGLPVLVAERPDFTAILERFPVGRTVRDFTAEAIAGTLRELLDDSMGRRQMSQAGLSAHETFFNYEEQFEPALSTYQSLLPKPEVVGTNRRVASSR